uniref:Arrestin-like N-terminal domain-containing protein n=1 Tax=Romanomermis culicivorax TaxID=13658 RepID=A0A915KJW4_ROMCU
MAGQEEKVQRSMEKAVIDSIENDNDAKIVNNPMLEIRLDQKDVRCGSKVIGSLILLPKKLSLEELTLKIRGTSSISLETDSGKKYSSNETHLYEKIILYSKKRGGHYQNQELFASDSTPLPLFQGQETTFPFEFSMPVDCPPTYHGRYVQIIYELQALAKFSDILHRKQTARTAFIVSAAKIFDANNGENVAEWIDAQKVYPTKLYREFFISLLEMQKPQIKMNIEVDRSTVDRSSENAIIQFDISVINYSKLTMVSLKYGLMQIIRSSIKGRQTVEKIILKEYENNSFELFPNKKWICKRKFDFSAEGEDRKFEVSNLQESLPSSFIFKSSKFSCDVSYFIFALLIPPNFGRTCELYLPLKLL